MVEKRRFQRFPLKLSARYGADPEPQLSSCSIIDISRTGMKLLLTTKEKIKVGSQLNVEISPPDAGSSIKCVVSVAWVAQMQDRDKKYFLCGGTFKSIKSEDKWRLLDSAYEAWKGRKEMTYYI